MTATLSKQFLIAFALIAGLARPSSAASEIPVPPMPAAKKASLEVPVLVSPSDVKAYVPGLGGFYNSAAHVASLNGRVHETCLKYLTLTAGSKTLADNSFPFALMATAGGLDCLQKTSPVCAASASEKCQSFQTLAADATYSKKFTARVDLGSSAVGNVKVALAKKALVLNDHSVKMEATADCCAVAVDPTLGDEKPLSRVATKNVEQIGKITQQIIDQEALEPRPADAGPAKIAMPPSKPGVKIAASKKKPKGDADDDDDKDDDGEDKPKLEAGLQHVMTDEEIEKKVRANMLPYEQQFQQFVLAGQQRAQMNAWSLQSMMAQQSQSQVGFTNAGLLNYNFSSVTPNATGLLSPFSGGLGSSTGAVPNTGLTPANGTPFNLPGLGIFK